MKLICKRLQDCWCGSVYLHATCPHSNLLTVTHSVYVIASLLYAASEHLLKNVPKLVNTMKMKIDSGTIIETKSCTSTLLRETLTNFDFATESLAQLY